MNGYISKPYELSDLHAVLRRHHPGPLPEPPIRGTRLITRPALRGLEDIPGLDPNCALNDTGISGTLYPRLLRRFRDETGDAPERVAAQIAAGDWEAVRHFAHTLKGKAGFLGMMELSRLAARLETAAGTGDPVRARDALGTLAQHLAPIVAGLERLLPAADAQPAAMPCGDPESAV
jgi:HPt (histidine-containing phosphotransfer) domain-containing protein